MFIEGEGAPGGDAAPSDDVPVEGEDTLRADLDAAIFGGEGEGDAATPAVDAAPAKPAADAAPDGDGAPKVDAADGLDADGIPSGRWTAEEREQLKAMPAESRKFLSDRYRAMQGDYTKKTEAIAPFRKAAEQWSPYLTSLNATPEQAFDALMRTDYRLRNGTPQQKEAAFVQLAKDYGVELDTGETAANADPLGVEIAKALTPLQREIAEMRQGFTGQQRQSEEARVNHHVAEIEAFRVQAGADGRPLHPHLDDVLPDLAAFAQADRAAGRAPVLKDLYDRAVWSNPTTRAKMIAAQAAPGAAARIDKARRAASTVSTSSSTPANPKVADRTLREELESSLPMWG